MNLHYYNRKREEVLKEMHTSENGLSAKERSNRASQYGENRIVEYSQNSLSFKFLEGFKNMQVIILLLGFVISLLIGRSTEAVIIAIIMIINLIILFVEKMQVENEIKTLQNSVSNKIHVLIEGVKTEVDSSTIVPGDILVLEEGTGIAADARVISQNDLRTYEKHVMNDSTPKRKFEKALFGEHIPQEQTNMVFMGTRVTHGKGLAVVIKTGMNTEFGKIAEHSQTKSYETPLLHKQLHHLESISAFAVVFIGLFVFVLGMFNGAMDYNYASTMLLFTLSLAIAIIPETLPLAVAMVLSYGAKQLSKENILIKKLSAVETIGKTTAICMNKTGVLTKNEMIATEIYLDDKKVTISGTGYNPNGEFQASGKVPSVNEMLSIKNILRISALCNDSRLEEDMNANTWKINGDQTDGSMIVAARKAGILLEDVWKKYPRMYESPYDSHSKMMISVNRINHEKIASIKGSPEEIIERSSRILLNGKVLKLVEKKKDELTLRFKLMAKRGLKVVAVAYNNISEKISVYYSENLSKDMIFVGFIGISDHLRPGMQEAIAQCTRAGIRLYIFTEDSKEATYSLASELGLANTRTLIVTEKELRSLNEDMLTALLAGEVIFSNISYEQKKRVVTTLRKMGQVVTAVGDSSFDVPMIKHADISVSIGNSAAAASKEASKIIINEGGFLGLVKAIRAGRNVFENIKKFTSYTISSKLGEAMTIFFGMVLGFPLPLLAIQLLATDFGIKALPSIALGTEAPESDLMDHLPRRKNEPIIDRTQLFRFIFIGLIMSAITLTIFGSYLLSQGWNFGMGLALDSAVYIKATTLVFVMIMLFHIINALNCRSQKDSIFRIGLLSNRFMVISLLVSFLVIISVVNVPYLQRIFHTTALSFTEWFAIIGVAAAILVIDEVRKIFVNYQQHRAIAPTISKAKIMSRFDIKITALTLIVLVFMMAFYMAFGTNTSSFGQQGKSAQLMANEPFVVKLQGAQEYSDILTIESPVKTAKLKFGGLASQTNVFIGSSLVYFSYDEMKGDSYTLKMYDTPKIFYKDDTILFEIPKGSKILSASIDFDAPNLDLTTDMPAPGIRVNGQPLFRGRNDLSNVAEFICDNDKCRGEIKIKVFYEEYFTLSNLEVEYSIPEIDLKPAIDSQCAAYPCELPIRISSETGGEFRVHELKVE